MAVAAARLSGSPSSPKGDLVTTTLPDLAIGRMLLPTQAPVIDRNATMVAAAQLLAALGVDEDTEIGLNTPRRVADAFVQLLSQDPWEFTTFPNDSGQHEVVVIDGIEFTSVCGHHLLPFSGVAAVGYRPADLLPGLSKIARTVEMFAARLQTQESLGQQIARFVQERLGCAGVGVVLRAEHTCMTCRGVRARGSSTITVATTGMLQADAGARAEFLRLTSMPRCAA